MFRKMNNNEKGFYATASVLMVIAVVFILSFSLMFLAENDQQNVKLSEAREIALNVAEEGLNDYLWHMNQKDDYYLTDVHPGQTGWVTTSKGRYHLEVEPLQSPGVQLIVTGETTVLTENGFANVTRKIKAIIRKRSFTRYVYFTDSEIGLDGEQIWYVTGDVIHGPLHSNDIISIDGNPVFEGKVTTHMYIYKKSGSNPKFIEGYEEHVPLLEIPESNADLINWARSGFGGYYYVGRTEIEFLSNGKIQITNSNPLSQGPTGVVDYPSSGVIYVDGPQNPVDVPRGKNYSNFNTYNNAKWNQSNANVFVKGIVCGKITIGSANNIYITGDLKYQNYETDMLGLIANNWILVNHYNQNKVDVAPQNIEIDGAVFALKKSFGFECFEDGPAKGTLKLVGTLAQAFRGPVGTFSYYGLLSGYNKDYWYDQRMLYMEPPHYIPPLNSGYEVVSWEEVKN